MPAKGYRWKAEDERVEPVAHQQHLPLYGEVSRVAEVQRGGGEIEGMETARE